MPNPLPDHLKRDASLLIMMTRAEKAQLKVLAEAHGFNNVSEYARAALGVTRVPSLPDRSGK